MSRHASPAVSQMCVLGVDPGLTRLGVGVVTGPPARPEAVAAEVVRTPSDDSHERRLLALHRAVDDLIQEHDPTAIAVERVLFSKNVRTAIGTAQAAAMAMVAAARRDLPVFQYSPTDVKLAVAGHGGADKGAVGRMVAAQLRLAEVPGPADAADALAVALCHLARARMGEVGVGGGAGSWEELIDGDHVRITGGTS